MNVMLKPDYRITKSIIIPVPGTSVTCGNLTMYSKEHRNHCNLLYLDITSIFCQ